MAKVADQDYEMVPVGQLQTHPDNPNQGNTNSIGASIDHLDFYGAVIVQRSTGYILAGNHRYLAAKAKGIAEIPAIMVDVDDDRAQRILLADNRHRDLATYDERALAELLTGLDGLDGTGYEAADLASLQQVTGMLGDAASAFLDEVPSAEPPPPRTVAPTAPPAPASPGTNTPSPPTATTAAPVRIETVQLSWAMTPEQRDTVRNAIAHAQHAFAIGTQPEALVAIAEHYLTTTRKQDT